METSTGKGRTPQPLSRLSHPPGDGNPCGEIRPVPPSWYPPPDQAAIREVPPETIQARVLFRELVDASPRQDMEEGFWAEVSCTSPASMVGTVSSGVSNAILRDLQQNELFLEVRKRMDDPDLILEGRIDRFMTKSGMNIIGVVTFPIDWITGGLFWLLGMPIRTSWGTVEMELTLRTPDGPVLGTYSGKRHFLWHHTVYNTRWALFGCPTKLNEMFGEVVREMRSAMIADRDLLEVDPDQ